MAVNYTDISKTYDNYRSYPESLIKKMLSLGRISQGKKILEIGCGTGNVASQLRQTINADVIGLDISFSMLKVARDKSLEVLCADMDNRQLPFLNGSFDAIIGAYVIHQVKNLDFIFAECYRVLRDGALVLLTSSHKQIENQHPIMKSFFPSYSAIDKARFPDISQIDKLLTSIGFRGIKHQDVTVAHLPVDLDFLEKVKNKYVSTYHLMPQHEFDNGIRQLEDFITNSKQPVFRDWRGTILRGLKN